MRSLPVWSQGAPDQTIYVNKWKHMNSDEMEKMMQGGALERLGEGGITG